MASFAFSVLLSFGRFTGAPACRVCLITNVCVDREGEGAVGSERETRWKEKRVKREERRGEATASLESERVAIASSVSLHKAHAPGHIRHASATYAASLLDSDNRERVAPLLKAAQGERDRERAHEREKHRESARARV